MDFISKFLPALVALCHGDHFVAFFPSATALGLPGGMVALASARALGWALDENSNAGT